MSKQNPPAKPNPNMQPQKEMTFEEQINMQLGKARMDFATMMAQGNEMTRAAFESTLSFFLNLVFTQKKQIMELEQVVKEQRQMLEEKLKKTN